MPTIKSHKLDFEKVSLSDVKTNDIGGKSIYVNYDKNIFKMQTPVMSMPYNLGAYENGDNVKYSIDVAFRDLDSDYRVNGFHDNMIQLEDFIIKNGMENSKTWFAKKIKSEDVLRALFTPIVKRSIDKSTGEPDGRYANTIKFKLPFYNGKAKFEVMNFEDEVIEDPQLEHLFTKETKVQAILRCGGIWIINGKFGCTWTVDKIRVEPKEVGGGEMPFINDSDDGDSDNSDVDDSSDDDE